MKKVEATSFATSYLEAWNEQDANSVTAFTKEEIKKCICCEARLISKPTKYGDSQLWLPRSTIIKIALLLPMMIEDREFFLKASLIYLSCCVARQISWRIFQTKIWTWYSRIPCSHADDGNFETQHAVIFEEWNFTRI